MKRIILTFLILGSVSFITAADPTPAPSRVFVLGDGRRAVIAKRHLFLVRGDGSVSPAQPGQYALPSGKVFIVNTDGSLREVGGQTAPGVQANQGRNPGGYVGPGSSVPNAPSPLLLAPPQGTNAGAGSQSSRPEANASQHEVSASIRAAPVNRRLIVTAEASNDTIVHEIHAESQAPLTNLGMIVVSVTDNTGKPVTTMRPGDVTAECLASPWGSATCKDLVLYSSNPTTGIWIFTMRMYIADSFFRIHAKTEVPYSPGDNLTPASMEGQTVVRGSYNMTPYWNGNLH